MLREVAHFLLPLLCCEFCTKPLLDPKLADKVFGEKAHTPLKKLKLTVHHRNGKHHDNNRDVTIANTIDDNPIYFKTNREGLLFAICGNTSLVHTPCHKQHEMKLTHKEGNLKQKPMFERARLILFKMKKPTKFSLPEMKFINRINKLVSDKGKVTRYEIRRLKKLAAKVEEKK